MNDLTRCPEPDALITLLYDNEGDPAERAALRSHLQRCAACADTFAALDHTRGALGSWPSPAPPLGFATLQNQAPLWRRVAPWAGLGAAAVLTLAGAAGLAQIDIRYDASGFTFRTGAVPGAARAPESITASTVSTTAAAGAPVVNAAVAAPAAGDPRTGWVARASEGEPPWRADFDLLATQLRADFDTRAKAAEQRVVDAGQHVAAASVREPVIDEDRLMRRIADRIDQGEVRQQQNLALRIAELGREFQLRRQADLVQFERGLARIENQRQDLIRRVAVSQVPQP